MDYFRVTCRRPEGRRNLYLVFLRIHYNMYTLTYLSTIIEFFLQEILRLSVYRKDEVKATVLKTQTTVKQRQPEKRDTQVYVVTVK